MNTHSNMKDIKNKLIIFDLDGVILDSIKFTEEVMMAKYPTLTRDKMRDMLRGNFYEEMDKFKVNNKPIVETEEEKKARQDKYAQSKSMAPLYDGIKDFLPRLKGQDFKLVINTSAAERNAVPPLKNSGIFELFDLVAAKELSKSKVEKFKIILDKYSLAPAQVLFITDTIGDLQEAHTAGIPTVAVTWGAHDRELFEIERNKGTFNNFASIVDSVSELENFISGYFR